MSARPPACTWRAWRPPPCRTRRCPSPTSAATSPPTRCAGAPDRLRARWARSACRGPVDRCRTPAAVPIQRGCSRRCKNCGSTLPRPPPAAQRLSSARSSISTWRRDVDFCFWCEPRVSAGCGRRERRRLVRVRVSCRLSAGRFWRSSTRAPSPSKAPHPEKASHLRAVALRSHPSPGSRPPRASAVVPAKRRARPSREG
mmetsp:Transcript_741/g.2026  ORF Transcript_741/g.2026 Transcript_741/m.2026 type:complete len:200 (+) Transcript_741:2631-3230(+)